jgi:hypothetical protein
MKRLLWSVAFMACQTVCAEDRALIIAIDHYPHLPREQQLSGTHRDSQLMQALLVNTLHYQPNQIKVLEDKAASREGILQAMDAWLVQGTKAGDRVFIHYSGHGVQVPDDNGDEKDGMDESWVPSDFENSGEPKVIRDDDIEKRLKALAGRTVTLISDSCQSGTISRDVARKQALRRVVWQGKGARGLDIEEYRQESTELVSPQVPVAPSASGFLSGTQTVWTAVEPTQYALEEEFEGKGGGHFTARLVRGIQDPKLADADRDGTVSHAELWDWLRGQSKAYCQSLGAECAVGLSPTLEVAPALMAKSIRTTLDPQSLAAPTAPATNNASLFTAPDAALKVALASADKRSQFKAGDTLRWQVNSNFDGFLTLLEVSPSGEITQLFPNEFSQSDRITAAKPVFTPPKSDYAPFELLVSPPLGKATLIALVTADKVNLRQQLKPLESVGNSEAILGEIAQRLRKAWSGDKDNRAIRWSAAVLPVVYVP